VKPVYRAYLDLALAMTIVGSSVVVAKSITGHIPIFLALSIRFMIALPSLILLCKRNNVLSIPPKNVLFRIFLQALTGVFLFNVLLFLGLRYTTASQSGVLTGTSPAFIAILGWLVLREKLSRYDWIGIFLSVAGIMLMNTIGTSNPLAWNIETLSGNALVIAAVICEAMFTIFRKSSQEVPALSGATWVTAFALILCLPVGIYELSAFDSRSITIMHWLTLMYYGLGVSVLGYFLWFRGLEQASTAAAGILTGIMPFSAVILSAIFLGESLTIAHLAGLALVIAAIAIMTRAPRRIEIST